MVNTDSYSWYYCLHIFSKSSSWMAANGKLDIMEWFILCYWCSGCFRPSTSNYNSISRGANHVIESTFSCWLVFWFCPAYVRRPHVSDFETLSEDVFHLNGFWNNNVTRVLLVIVLANIGSSIGTFVGGADVIRLFLENL